MVERSIDQQSVFVFMGNDSIERLHMSISGVIVAGGPLTRTTMTQVEAAAAKTDIKWRRYVAYSTYVKVGGSLAWRANNPGNLREAPTKIGLVPGQTGHFAVFPDLDTGRSAQKSLYLAKYGTMKVKDAVGKLTPPAENDTDQYLSDLKKAGVDLDKDVASQITLLMQAIQVNEGLIVGITIERTK